MDPRRYRRLKELVDQALDLFEYQRDVYLQENCDDVDMLADARDLLRYEGAKEEGIPGQVVLSADLPDLINSKVGPYEILDTLGEGGMGVVYLAAQSAPLRRRVALKVIKLGMDTREVMARFESERQALALMDHPNIAKVFDAGATDEGRPYFVMEYIPGVPLNQYCRDKVLGLSQRIDLFLEVCRGVQHAHQKGIIHRDLKPGNILVTEVEGVPIPKIIDFGVAKATASNLAGQTIFTRLGQVIGTPEYMSPEQAGSSMTDVDTRSDVYSLGVLLYELLTGTLPLERRDILQAGIQNMVLLVQNEIPMKPSTRIDTQATSMETTLRQSPRDTRIWARQVRGDLDWITMKALEKEPARRYGSVGDLAADLLRHMGNEPVLAGPPDRGYRIRKFLRRHRTGMTVAVLLLSALVLGILGTTVGMIRASRAEKAALAAGRRVEASYLYELAKNEAVPTRQLALATRAMELDNRPESRRLSEHLLLTGPSYFMLPRAEDAHNPWLPVFSPDGQWLAVGWSKRGLIQLFDTRTGSLHELEGQGGMVISLDFSSDSRTLLACFTDNRIQLWSVPEKRLDRTWVTEGLPRRAWFANQGSRIIVALLDSGKPITWWEYSLVGDEMRELGVTGGALGNLQNASEFDLDPTRRWIVMAEDKRLELFDLQDLAAGSVSLIGTHPDPIVGVRFHPDGIRVLSYDGHGKARLWDSETARGTPLRDYSCSENPVMANFSADGRHLSLGSAGAMQVWNLDLPDLVQPLKIDSSHNWMFAGAFSPDGRWLATTGSRRMVALWPYDRSFPLAIDCPPEMVIGSAFSPDGKWLITSEGERIRAWPLTGSRLGEPRLLFEAADHEFGPVRFDDASRFAFVTSCNSSQGLGIIYRIPLDGGPVRNWSGGTCHFEVSPDGRYLAASRDEAMARFHITLWDTEAGSVQELEGPGSLDVAGFSQDNLLLGFGDGVLGLWTPDGSGFRPLRSGVGFARLAPDRVTYLFTRESDSEWNRGRTDSDLTEALGMKFLRGINSLGTDSTATILVSGCPHGEVEILDFRTGRQFWLPLHEKNVQDALLDPKGRWLSSSAPGRMLLMPFPRGRTLGELPREEYLDLLHGMTNVRVVPDTLAATGYEFVGSEGFDWRLPRVPD